MKLRFAAALLASVALFGLAACDDPPPEKAVKIYKPDAAGMAECKADHDAETCDKALGKAKEQHDTSAPRVSSREECINKYGVEACTPKQDSSGNWFVPAMAGFMVGQALSNLTQPAAQPVYVDRQGSAYSNNGNQLGNYRSACQPNDPGCRSGGFVSAPATSGGGGAASSPAWMSNYNTTAIKPSGSGGSGSSKTYAIAPSTRGGFGSTAGSSASGYSNSTIGKGSSSSPAATSSGASARGGFGGSAASSSSSAGG